MRPIAKTLVLLVAVLVATGCGSSSGGGPPFGRGDEEGAVRGVIMQLEEASRDGEGGRICNQIFTPKLADSVTSSAESGSCAKEVKAKLFTPDARITVETVDVTDQANAKATIKEQNGKTSTVFLVKQSGEWRVRSGRPL